jgi:hypothetical protein
VYCCAVTAVLTAVCWVCSAASAATLTGIACPSQRQCTAVNSAGQELTFDPSSRRAPRPLPIEFAHRSKFLDAVACPSVRECVAVDWHGTEVTFNPRAPGHPRAVEADRYGYASGYPVPSLTSIACPSVSQCTAVDNQGDFVTFDPAAPHLRDDQSIDQPDDAYTNPPSLRAVACPSASRCIAVDSYGDALTFAPWGGANPLATAGLPANGLETIACLAVHRCVATDDAQSFTFNPAIFNGPNGDTIDRAHPIRAMACPTAGQCTAVDEGGFEVTFDPSMPAVASPVKLSAGTNLDAIACPSASECVAVGASGTKLEFDPASG